MKESIGNSYVFTVVIVVIFTITTIVLSSMAYSKTYKIKNRLLEIIDKYEGIGTNDSNKADIVKKEMETFLKTAGYATSKTFSKSCPDMEGSTLLIPTGTSSYKYCVYGFNTIKGFYYTVRVYMTIELPLVSEFITIEFPMVGETKVYYRL